MIRLPRLSIGSVDGHGIAVAHGVVLATTASHRYFTRVVVCGCQGCSLVRLFFGTAVIGNACSVHREPTDQVHRQSDRSQGRCDVESSGSRLRPVVPPLQPGVRPWCSKTELEWQNGVAKQVLSIPWDGEVSEISIRLDSVRSPRTATTKAEFVAEDSGNSSNGHRFMKPRSITCSDFPTTSLRSAMCSAMHHPASDG